MTKRPLTPTAAQIVAEIGTLSDECDRLEARIARKEDRIARLNELLVQMAATS